MEILITGIVLSFVITLLLLPVIIRIAAVNKLFVVRQFRKVHTQKVSSLGGIAIFASVFFVMLFFSDFESLKPLKFYLAAGLFIFLVGLRDDFKNVNPWVKLLGQILATLIIIFPGGLKIEQFILNGTIYNLHPALSTILTLIVVIWIVNAYNFFDGIDIQAALMGIFVLAPAGIWFYFTQQYNFGLLLLTTSAALSAFLIFNFSPSKIFMGDSGTMTIGFIFAFSFIKFTSLNTQMEFVDANISNPFIFGLIAFQLPLFDSLRVVFFRLIKKKKLTKADKSHFHHLLLKLNWSHFHISLLSGFYTLIMLFLNYYLYTHTSKFSILILANLLTLSLLYSFIFFKLKMQKAIH